MLKKNVIMAGQIAQGENVEGLNAERKEVTVALQLHINIQLHKSCMWKTCMLYFSITYPSILFLYIS